MAKTLLLGLIKIFGSALNPDLMDEMLKHQQMQCKKCLHIMCMEPDCKYNICFCKPDKMMLVNGDENKDILMHQIIDPTFYISFCYLDNADGSCIVGHNGYYKLLKASKQVKYYNKHVQGLLVVYQKTYDGSCIPLSVVKHKNFKIFHKDSELIEYINS